jgi:hypothetical protein
VANPITKLRYYLSPPPPPYLVVAVVVAVVEADMVEVEERGNILIL